jgi:predicted dehydrogenase
MNARISIVGVGMAAQQYHLPAIKYIGARLGVLVEKELNVLKNMAKVWSPKLASSDLNAVVPENTDLCIVSTPPDSHLPIALRLMEKGVHVLVEKPLVLSMKDYELLCEAERKSAATCFGGQVRRFFPNIVILKSIIQENVFGCLEKLKIAEGALFRWRTISGYIKSATDEGVITDTGAHLFDIVNYLLEEYANIAKIRECAVDRYPQTNNLHLIFINDQGCEVDVRLSRTHQLANKIYAITERAILVTESGFSTEPIGVMLKKHGRPCFYVDASRSLYNVEYAFVLQLKEVLDALRSNKTSESRIHYLKLKKTIQFFDIVRSNYRVTSKVDWEDL